MNAIGGLQYQLIGLSTSSAAWKGRLIRILFLHSLVMNALPKNAAIVIGTTRDNTKETERKR